MSQMGPTYQTLQTIQLAVREAFEEDASGELRLTVSGIEIRPMADGSNDWAVFAHGEVDGHDVCRRRICHGAMFATSDLPNA